MSREDRKDKHLKMLDKAKKNLTILESDIQLWDDDTEKMSAKASCVKAHTECTRLIIELERKIEGDDIVDAADAGVSILDALEKARSRAQSR
jgi:hypothetical protein